MARIGESADLFKCSFCGKSQKQVQQLIAGPGVYICDECVELCNEIIEERAAEQGAGDLDWVDLQIAAAETLTRVLTPGEVVASPERIAAFTEVKTVWHTKSMV